MVCNFHVVAHTHLSIAFISVVYYVLVVLLVMFFCIPFGLLIYDVLSMFT